jgi:hypothetical protein
MTKDEALKLALEALESIPEEVEGYLPESCTDAVIAIKQALAAPVQEHLTGLDIYLDPNDGLKPKRYPAAQPAPVQEPDWKAEYLKSVESGCITLDELREANAELEATNRQVEILSDALAESRREIDALVALARADERERIKEENQRCYAVRGNT